MIEKIETLADVRQFAIEIIAEGVRLHPDDDFSEMTNDETDQPVYSAEDSMTRNNLMTQCFQVCDLYGEDIYGIMLEVYQKELGICNI